MNISRFIFPTARSLVGMTPECCLRSTVFSRVYEWYSAVWKFVSNVILRGRTFTYTTVGTALSKHSHVFRVWVEHYTISASLVRSRRACLPQTTTCQETSIVDVFHFSFSFVTRCARPVCSAHTGVFPAKKEQRATPMLQLQSTTKPMT